MRVLQEAPVPLPLQSGERHLARGDTVVLPEDGSNDQKICGEKNPKDLWFGIKNILFDMFSTMSKSNVPFPKGNAWLPRLVAVDFTVDKGGEIWLHEIHWTAEPDMRLLGWVYDTYHQYLATGQLKNRNGGRIFDLLDNNLS